MNDDFCFFFLPFGYGMTQKRLDLIKKRILELNKGHVANLSFSSDITPISQLLHQHVTHIITSGTDDISFRRILDFFLLNIPSDTKCQIPTVIDSKRKYNSLALNSSEAKKKNECFLQLITSMMPLSLLPQMKNDNDMLAQTQLQNYLLSHTTIHHYSYRWYWVSLDYVIEFLKNKCLPIQIQNYDSRQRILKTITKELILEYAPNTLILNINQNLNNIYTSPIPPQRKRYKISNEEYNNHKDSETINKINSRSDNHQNLSHKNSDDENLLTPIKRFKKSFSNPQNTHILKETHFNHKEHNDSDNISTKEQQQTLTGLSQKDAQHDSNNELNPNPTLVPIVLEELSEDELLWSGLDSTVKRPVLNEMYPKKNKKSNNSLNASSFNQNIEITKMLQRLHDLYSQSKDEPWRTRAYALAVANISRLPFKIKTEADLDKKEVHIGIKTKDKIKEFLKTGKSQILELLEAEPKRQTVDSFSKIWGVAATTAEKFYADGLRSLDDLKKNRHRLTTNQQIGLDFYDELNTRIPRFEAQSIITCVKNVIRQMFTCEQLSIIAAGSFRRGSSTCGDVDILICKRTEGPLGDELPDIVAALHHNKLITHDLTKCHSKCTTYMGLCQLKPDMLHRRIDIKLYPSNEIPFALLHFTGGSHFNRSMRLLVKKMGFSLTDHGFFNVYQNREAKTPINTECCCKTEKQIFEVMGLKYRYPWNREVDADWNAEFKTMLKKGTLKFLNELNDHNKLSNNLII